MSNSNEGMDSITYDALETTAPTTLSDAPPEIFIDEASRKQAEDIAARVKAVMATIPRSPASVKRRMEAISHGIRAGAASVAARPVKTDDSDEWERVRMRRAQMVDSLCACMHKQQAKTEKTRIKYQRLVKKVTTIEEYYADDHDHSHGHDLPRRLRPTVDRSHDRS